MKSFRILFIIITVLFYVTAIAQDEVSDDSLVTKPGNGFSSETIDVNGTKIHFVRGGAGPVVVLLHGFPQDWYEYHAIMPRLAKKFTVIAVDLRGVGKSSVAPNGYDAPNLATDIDQLVRQLNLKNVYIVGHDIGGIVAYAFARLYSDRARGVMILDVPLPGLNPWNESIAGPQFWMLNFHQVPGLPEKLVSERQSVYFHYILDPFHFNDRDVEHYVKAYSGDHLHAGFELYRAFPADGEFNSKETRKLDLPIAWIAGEDSFFGKIGSKIADALRAHGCKNVKTEIIKDCGHYLVNEQPQHVTELIERYASL